MIRRSLVDRSNWDKTAVIDGDSRLSYRDIAQRAYAVMGALPGKIGENISIFLPGGGDFLAALYGVMMAGQAAFPLNVQLTVHEIASLLRQGNAKVVITSKTYRPMFEEAAKVVPVEVVYMEELPEFEGAVPPAVEDIAADEPMLLLATSGTTGNAKIVRLSEENVAASTRSYIDKMDFEKVPEQKIRLTLGTPFSSVYGLMVLTACVIKSIPVVVLGEPFTLERFYRAVEKHRITHFEGGVSVGHQMEQTAGRPNPYDISSLCYAGLAGSSISADTLRRLTEAYPGVEFWPGYGMTEAGPLIAKPDKKVNMEKLDSVGTKVDCVTIMIDAGGTLTDAPGVRGEIAVKGPGVMLGYYNNEEETKKVLKNGYLYTGDIGYLDGDGFLYVCGRKKNIIIVRGFNVHPEEVEGCLMNSGLVKDCMVYGEADSKGNETVCAHIVPVAPAVSADEIRAWCKEHLAGYKCPRRIQLTDEIKKTPTGKTERK